MKTQTEKAKALAKYLNVEVDEVKERNEGYFKVDNAEYIVLTDDEAEESARDYILGSVWAFKKSFLDAHSEIIAKIDDKTWEAVVSKCESANNAVLAMIKDEEHFVDDAIASDGRGHFISAYDGEENEQDGFYIYRTN